MLFNIIMLEGIIFFKAWCYILRSKMLEATIALHFVKQNVSSRHASEGRLCLLTFYLHFTYFHVHFLKKMYYKMEVHVRSHNCFESFHLIKMKVLKR